MKIPCDREMMLWDGEPPYGEDNRDRETWPTIRAWYPQEWRRNGKAVVIFPGGGYSVLAPHEGRGYAEWLAGNGYTAFVVNYRLQRHGYHWQAILSDAARAVRLVRVNAAEMGIEPHKIGVMGSSAGGHLAAMCSTLHEEGWRQSDEPSATDLGRPDFSILCYPVISSTAPWSHCCSSAILPENAGEELRRKVSMELSANAHTPPAFLWHCATDSCVPCENSIYYALRLHQFRIPVRLHVYERCEHGIGLADGHPWTAECLDFLRLI